MLDRKLLRDLTGMRLRLLAISCIMALGVMCFIYMRSSYNNLRLAQAQYYAQCRLADFWIDLKKAHLTELESLSSLPGIEEIQTRISFFATVDLEFARRPLNGLVLSLPDRRESTINDIVLLRGGYFTEERREEVIVNNAFAAAHGLYPGDTIHLLLNNRRQQLFIVGTAISAEFVYLVTPGSIAPDPRNSGVFYIKRSFAEAVFDMDGAANQVVGLLAPGIRSRTADVLDQAEKLLQPFGVAAVIPRADQASHRFLSDEIRGLGVFSTILPAIFLSVAALVLNILLGRTVDQQRTVVGTLKATGYADRQLFLHFLKFGLSVGGAGGLLGCILGFAMSEWITSIYRQFYEFLRLENYVYIHIYSVAMAICFACAAAGSLRSCTAALRLQPAEAMRPPAPVARNAVLLERWSYLWQRLSSGWRMSLRNVARHRMRTAVGAFASAMGAAILMTGLMSAEGTTYLLDFQYERVIKSDIDLQFQDEKEMDAVWEVQQLPGVDYAEPVLNAACDFRNGAYERKGAVTGLTSDPRLTVPRDAEGRKLNIPRQGLLMSRKLAALLHVQSGGLLTLTPVKGLREPVQARVERITDSFLGMAVYADIHYLSKLIHEELAINGVQLLVNPAADVRAEFFRSLKQLPGLQSTQARQDTINNLDESVVKLQRVFIGFLIVFAGMVFFGSMLNSALVSLAERRREVATFHVLGYSPWQIGGIFFRENMLVNLIGVLAGLPLGYLLMYWITEAYETELFRLPLVAPLHVWIETAVVGVVFGLFAQLFVQREIHRMDWLEALKVRE